HEVEEAQRKATGGARRIGRELILVLAGVAAMAAGATLLVEAINRITGVESAQTALGLTLVGFATAFELVVLAWSAARRGASEAVVAGGGGSFAYKMTMTLGAGARVRAPGLGKEGGLGDPLLCDVWGRCVAVMLCVSEL